VITGDATARPWAAQPQFDAPARRTPPHGVPAAPAAPAAPAQPAPPWPQVDPENVQGILGGGVLLVLSSSLYGASARAVVAELHRQPGLDVRA
jgi:hypothetical protein